MGIEIKITDPANTPAADIQLVITLLSRFAGGQFAPAVPAAQWEHADLPDTGGFQPTPEQAFGHSDPSPEQAFGAAPLIPGASAAPYTAGVDPASIALAAALSTSTASAPALQMAAPAPGSLAPTAAAPAPQAAPAPGGVQVDSTGLPWDASIHAKATGGGGVMNADNTWRAKRGVDAAFKAQREAQLRSVMGAPAAAPLPNAAPLPTAGPASSGVPASAPAGVAPAYAPSAPAPTPGVPAAPTANYVELVNTISAAMGANKINADDVRGACVMFGIPDLPLLASRLDLVSSVSARINAVIASRG